MKFRHAIIYATFGLSLTQPALAAPAKWQYLAQSKMGAVAALVGNPGFDAVVINCPSPGNVEMRVKLARGIDLPPRGTPVQIYLSGYVGGSVNQVIVLPPRTENPGEYSGPINETALDLLASANPLLDMTISSDNGESWLQIDEGLSLSGSSAAVKGVRASCQPAGAPAMAGGGDAAIRKAIADTYKGYGPNPENAPPGMGFSPELDRYVMRATKDGIMDSDPICGCQDFDPIKFRYTITKLTMDGPDRATADIRVNLFGRAGEDSANTLKLLRTAQGKWTIDDIIDAEGSFKQSARDAKPGSWALE